MRLHYHARCPRVHGNRLMASLEIESTLTDRYQTTVPDAVRRTLKLRKRDKIRYVVRPDGAVLLTRAEAGEESDPVVGKFLATGSLRSEEHTSELQSQSNLVCRLLLEKQNRR